MDESAIECDTLHLGPVVVNLDGTSLVCADCDGCEAIERVDLGE